MAFNDPNSTKRQKVTVPASSVDVAISDYVVYVDMSGLDSDMHTEMRSDGLDIKIYDSGGTNLDREVVNYDQSGETGQLYFRGDVSNVTDTDFYVEVGSGDSVANDTTTWTTANYAIRASCDETSGDIADSCGNYTGTNTGCNLGNAGKIGNCIDFDGGSADNINWGDVTELNSVSSYTLEYWCKYNSLLSGKHTMLKYGSSSDSTAQIQDQNGTDLRFYNRDSSSNEHKEYGNYNNDISGFDHYVWVYDGSQSAGDRLKLYFNGSSKALTNGPVNLPTQTANLATKNFTLGNPLGAGNLTPDMCIDEFRLATDAKTAGWASAQYSNQNDPGSFYTIAAIESNEGGVVTVTTYNRRLRIKMKQKMKVGKNRR